MSQPTCQSDGLDSLACTTRGSTRRAAAGYTAGGTRLRYRAADGSTGTAATEADVPAGALVEGTVSS